MTPFCARAAAASAVLCTMAALPGCSREAPAPRAEREEFVVPVGAQPAERAGIRAVVRASGVIAPAEGAEFLAVAPEPARIAEVTKAAGDPVTSGEVLVRFDLPSAAQDVARLTADLAAAQAQLESARINQQRVRDFVDRGMVPRRDLQTADRELAEAQAAVDRVRAAHAAALAAADRAVLRAPFEGIVASRHHHPGDLVLSTSADPVLRIVDPRRLDVIAAVPETDAPRVVPGATARLASGGGIPVTLKVQRRLEEQIGAGDTVPFRLVFDAPSELPVDTPVEVDIDAEERMDAVLVPAEAVIRDGGQTVVMIAAGSRAERRPVTTGIEDEAKVEITSGVRAGEMVITRGHIGLEDGAPISVAGR